MQKIIKLRLPKRFMDGKSQKDEFIDDFLSWTRSVEEGNNVDFRSVRDPWAFFRKRAKP